MRNCPDIKRTRRLIRRDNRERQQKLSENAQPKTSNKLVKYMPKNASKSTSKPAKKKSYGYVADDDDDSTSEAKESLSNFDT